MKYEVDQDVCIGCGACMAACPENFNINDAGVSEVISNENVSEENVDICPVGAIKVVEATEGAKIIEFPGAAKEVEETEEAEEDMAA